jgi:hypothetical protein
LKEESNWLGSSIQVQKFRKAAGYRTARPLTVGRYAQAGKSGAVESRSIPVNLRHQEASGTRPLPEEKAGF